MSYSINIEWFTEDVHSLGYNLTEEEAIEVLKLCLSQHDATIGINWEVLEYWVNHLYPDKDNREA